MHDESQPSSERARPVPWTKTAAAIDFSERTIALFEFSEAIEKALEEDYFHNPWIYTDQVLSGLSALNVLIQQREFPADDILRKVRELGSHNSALKPS